MNPIQIGLVAIGGLAVIFFLFWVIPGFFIINARQVGVLTRKNFGTRLPEGHIIARHGEIGIQAETLMPGFYWRFPLVWSVKHYSLTIIKENSVGLVEAVDGAILPANRLLGDEVDCNSFQDAKKFLESGGFKGPQVGILRPGQYRINLSAFTVTEKAATTIAENNLGVAIALDGKPLPTGYIIAPKPDIVGDLSFFQNGQLFLMHGGYRGPQLDTIQPGTYYINTLLFDIKEFAIAEVPPGFVAVIRSNVGMELEKGGEPTAPTGEGKMVGTVHADVERILTTDKDKRGIWADPVAPGKYNLNPIAFTPFIVPTSAVTIDWASEGRLGTDIPKPQPYTAKGKPNPSAGPSQRDIIEDEGVIYRFDPLKVTSMDGFLLEVNVRMVIRVQPHNAAFIIARFGSVPNLIDQIVHPLIDASFRNKAGEKKAIDFFQSRTSLQSEALTHAKDVFAQYNVEAQNLLIAYIDIPTNLLETQTRKEIAIQQKTQYDAESDAQTKRIAVEQQTATADKQKEVVSASLEIGIKQNLAKARQAEADGEAVYKQKIAAAEGIGLAEGLKAQKEALGDQMTAAINIFGALAKNNIRIVPEVMVGGGEGNFMGLLAGFLGTRMLTPIEPKPKSTEKQPT